MKSNAKVTFCDTKRPLKLPDGKTLYKTAFTDDDGLQGIFYSSTVKKFGDDVTIRLEVEGDKFKFKVEK